jgi:hypothetical protein
MRYCPKCQNKYNDEMNVCVVDGSPLRVSDPEAETLKFKHDKQNIVLVVRKEIVKIGDYVNLAMSKGSVRVTVKDIVEADFATPLLGLPTKLSSAHISFDGFGGVMNRGAGTKPIGIAEFLVPARGEGEGQEFRSVYFFHIVEDEAFLFRLLVDHINIHSKEVELNVAFFRYSKE